MDQTAAKIIDALERLERDARQLRLQAYRYFSGENDAIEGNLRVRRFLQAFMDANGTLSVHDTNAAAKAAGYDDGRAVNGFYKGDGLLTKDGEQRTITERGRQWFADHEYLEES